MIFKKYTHQTSLIIIFLGLLSQASFVYPTKNFMDRFIELSLYGCYFAIANNILENMCQNTPILHQVNSCDEKFLQYTEERVNQLKLVLENPTEDALVPFRAVLQKQYKKILNNRDILSLFFERDIPHQPWALLNKEIEQLLYSLESFRSKLYKRNFTMIESQSLAHEEALQFFDRIQKTEDSLISIKNVLQSYPSFQSECSQARQEKSLSNITRQIVIFMLLYVSYQNAKYLDKYCH